MSIDRRAYYDDDFLGFIEQVLQGGHLDDVAKGIAKKVVAKGIDSLSKKQQYIFEQKVFNIFARETCSSCSQMIPWSERYAAYDNNCLSSWCEHMLSKED